MTQESYEAETMRQEASRALAAAGEQIALALKESQPQVEALGEALHQLAVALARKDELTQVEIVALNAAMMQAVNRLQFYDRMTQHLTHVQDYLLAQRAADRRPAARWRLDGRAQAALRAAADGHAALPPGQEFPRRAAGRQSAPSTRSASAIRRPAISICSSRGATGVALDCGP